MENVDPTVAAAISMIAAALATAILRYAAYHWPSGYHKRGAVKNESKHEPNDRDNDEAPDQ